MHTKEQRERVTHAGVVVDHQDMHVVQGTAKTRAPFGAEKEALTGGQERGCRLRCRHAVSVLRLSGGCSKRLSRWERAMSVRGVGESDGRGCSRGPLSEPDRTA
jgi:hypothetical protein